MINFEKLLVYNARIKLILIIFILICIYFLKSYIFWYLKMLVIFIISYILDYGFKLLKFFSFDSFQCKDIFLKLFTLSVLLWLIFTNKINFILDNIFFIYLIFINFCLYLGYRKVERKKKTFLFLQFEILFYLFFVGFFIMYPIFKLTNLFYLEKLYYNLLQKLNILLTFFVWTMLNLLKETTKYSSNGLFLVYFYLKKDEKFPFLLKAYFFCINIAFCVLIEKTYFFYKIILEQVLFKYINLSKEILSVFFFIGSSSSSSNKKELQDYLLMKVYKNSYEYSCIKYGCVVYEKELFYKEKAIT